MQLLGAYLRKRSALLEQFLRGLLATMTPSLMTRLYTKENDDMTRPSAWIFQLGACLAALVLAAGCQFKPRDLGSVASTDQSQEFSGLVPNPGGTVEIQVRKLPAGSLCSVADNGGGTWTKVATVNVATTPWTTDDCGTKWYAYSTTLPLKNANTYWCDFGGYTTIFRSDYRAVWNGQVLTTFRADADNTCHPSKNCGANIAAECGAGQPYARILCTTSGAGGTCKLKF